MRVPGGQLAHNMKQRDNEKRREVQKKIGRENGKGNKNASYLT